MLGQLVEHSREVTVIDMEASVEHMSRGTVRHADVLLLVAEPYYRALETVGRMAPLAADLGIPHRLVVANKVRHPKDEEAIAHYCAGHGLEVIGVLPFDTDVLDADQSGTPVLDRAPEAAYVKEAARIATRVLERASRTPSEGP